MVVVVLLVSVLSLGSSKALPSQSLSNSTTSTFGPDISCAAGVPADCSYADLRFADFIAFNLTGANFTGADLQNAKFNFAYLVNATFTGANLANTDFTDANLTGARVPASSLQMAILCNTVLPDGTNSAADCP
jgi:uncharacterized protein YjbI with pentapeptide repeats